MRGSVIYQDILQQGALKLIRSQLNWRLGEIEPALLERVRELSPEQLDNLAVALFNFSEVRDLADWLDQQQPRERTVDLIIRQLKRRLGEVEPVLIEQVRRLPIVELEALAEALLDFSEVADLVDWLEQAQ